MKKSILLLIIVTAPVFLLAQGVAINNNNTEADPSAMLDIQSNNKGLLIPRMSQSEMETIISPANGLVVFNTTDSKLYSYSQAETAWKEIAFGTNTISPVAAFTIGAGGSCNNTSVLGDYKTGQTLTAAEFVTIEVDVTAIGVYSISTNTSNGFSFSASGSFSAIGIQTVDLLGTGTPVAYQTDNFTATASNGGGTCSFDVFTNISCGSNFTDARDGQSYGTVQIGSQCWMDENINIGTTINGNNNQMDNGTIEKYCYNNSSSNCNAYGGLYQWNEIMGYVTTEGVQGICPDGWHIPSDGEYSTLTNYLGGLTVAGGKMKRTGTSYWSSPNTGASNSSGFTALPGGHRHATTNDFESMSIYGKFWTSTVSSGSNAWRRNLHYDHADIFRSATHKNSGFSLRCIQD